MAAYKVIQWGTGGVGVWALRQVLDAPDLELVGLKCATDASNHNEVMIDTIASHDA
jgi:hypothetical protein